MLESNFESIKQSIDTSVRGTARYVHLRILSSNRDAYLSAINEFLFRLKIAKDMTDIKISICDVKYGGDVKFKNRFLIFPKGEEKRLYKMACQHIEDIVNSVEMRFVTGGFDAIPRNYKYGGICVYKDEGIL